MTDEESNQWLLQNKLSLSFVHSFNFIDFEDKDLPFKKGFSKKEPINLDGRIGQTVKLALTQASFLDNLVNPFNDEESGEI